MSDVWGPPFADGMVSAAVPAMLATAEAGASESLERWRAAIGQGNETEIERLVQQAHADRNRMAAEGRIGSPWTDETGER